MISGLTLLGILCATNVHPNDNKMAYNKSQIEREKTLFESIPRYYSKDSRKMGKHHVAHMTSTVLRNEILSWFKEPSNSKEQSSTKDSEDQGSTEQLDLFETTLDNFQKELGKLCGISADEESESEVTSPPKKTGRPLGSKHSFRQIWMKLDLDLKDHFKEESALLFYITLYIAIENTINYVADKEFDDPEEIMAAYADLDYVEDGDKAALEETDDDDEFVNNDDLSLSQQHIYAKIWETIAVELFFRPEKTEQTKVGRKSRSIYRPTALDKFYSAEALASSFAEKKGIDYKKRIEFATTLFDVLNSSFAEQWFNIESDYRETSKYKGKIKVIRPTQILLEQISKLRMEKLTLTHHAPLIEVPLDWGPLGIQQGGFYHQRLPFYKFHLKNQKIKDFLVRMNQSAWFDEVFAAMNVLQRTPWRINQRLWEVVAFFYEMVGVAVPSLGDNRLFTRKKMTAATNSSTVEASVHQETADAVTPTAPVIEPRPGVTPKIIKSWQKWLKSEEHFYQKVGRRARGPGARLATRVAISTLLDALPRPRIYFAHQADTRGRLYPLGSILHPQGDDLNRALLEFADPLPLTEAGIRPLAIYGSQQIKDSTILDYFQIKDRIKPTLDERFEWITAHTEQIMRCADAPLLETWWRGGDAADAPAVSKPFTFLAFCFAWADYQKNGAEVACHLPVHVDGTCNGLQHIAALTGNVALAEATNVLPSEYPRDIYSEVADAVRENMLQPAIKKTSSKKTQQEMEDWQLADEGAIEFLRQFGHLVDRALAKTVVMIIPYGAGQVHYQHNIYKKLSAKISPRKVSNRYRSNSYADWIMALPNIKQWEPQPQWLKLVTEALSLNDDSSAETRKPFRKISPNRLRIWTINRWLREVCAYHLAYHFNQVVRDKYPTIHDFKRLLTNTIKPIVEEANIPVMWASPSGMPVLQQGFKNDKRLQEVEVVAVNAIRFRIRQITDDVSIVKQLSGILPNFIHSLDAAHLVKTINRAREREITSVSTVHDSYATHACHVEILGECIREAFCAVYPPDQDRLLNFRRWCRALEAVAQVSSTGPYTAVERALLDLARLWTTNGKASTSGQDASTSPEEGEALQSPDRTHESGTDIIPMRPGYWTDQVKLSQYFFS